MICEWYLTLLILIFIWKNMQLITRTDKKWSYQSFIYSMHTYSDIISFKSNFIYIKYGKVMNKQIIYHHECSIFVEILSWMSHLNIHRMIYNNFYSINLVHNFDKLITSRQRGQLAPIPSLLKQVKHISCRHSKFTTILCKFFKLPGYKSSRQ
jgi:hypothetical protein